MKWFVHRHIVWFKLDLNPRVVRRKFDRLLALHRVQKMHFPSPSLLTSSDAPWAGGLAFFFVRKISFSLQETYGFSSFSLPDPRWSYLELSGTTWSYLEVFGVTWSYLELSGSVTSYLDLSGCISSYLEIPGAFWSYLELSEAIWSYLELSGIYRELSRGL